MSSTTITMLSPNGLPTLCETCGRPASGAYRNTLDRMVPCCTEHNPFTANLSGVTL